MSFKLYSHQKKALSKLNKNKTYALFMEQGTGKTLVAIKRIEKLVKIGKAHRILIVALNAALDNWLREFGKFYQGPEIKPIIWEGNKTKRKQLVDQLKKDKNTPYVILINYEKIRLDKDMLIRLKPDLLILDESHKVKNYKSQVNKALKRICTKCNIARRYLLTGTPFSVGYEDYFGQFLIMAPEILGDKYKHFEDKYLKLGGFQGKEVVGYKNVDELKALIKSKSYTIKKKDCLDLPPVSIQNLYCELGPKAKKAYKELDKELITEVEGLAIGSHSLSEALKTFDLHNIGSKQLVALDSALIKSMKLQQITGGFIKHNDSTILIDKSKLNLLADVVETSPKPIIIFCRYTAEINTIMELLGKNYKVAELSGKVKNKGQVVQQFQDGKYDILIIQIKTGSASINLTRASVAIFYSWSSSYIDMEQAKARLDRIGQKNPVNIYYLVSRGTVDEVSLEIIQKRHLLSKNFE